MVLVNVSSADKVSVNMLSNDIVLVNMVLIDMILSLLEDIIIIIIKIAQSGSLAANKLI